MYYLVERNFRTGKWGTNFTMYGLTPEDILNRIFPDGLYHRDYEVDGHCSMMYRHINTGKEVGIIFSVF